MERIVFEVDSEKGQNFKQQMCGERGDKLNLKG